MPASDLIITAANRAQARGYAMQVRQRRREGRLNAFAHALVAPDPGGFRVGSGTATLFALRALVKRIRHERGDMSLAFEDVLAGRRVLIIHSGGDSRRLPAYAAQGKIFTPLPMDSQAIRTATLFDLMLDDLSSITLPAAGGVIIASGDVLLGIARERLGFDDGGVAAVASPGPIERAARHGVFVRDANGLARAALQKPNEATMRDHDALDADGRALIDLGLAFVPARDAARWLHDATLCEIFSGRPPHIDLYADMLPALVPQATSRTSPAATDARASAFLRTLQGCGLGVEVAAEARFFHIGSSRELLDNLTSAGTLQSIGASADPAADNACVFASILDAASYVDTRCVIESCWIERSITLKGNNIVVGVPPDCTSLIELPRNAGLVCLPVGKSDWAAIAFGLDDDFKTAAQRGGTFAGRPLHTLDHRCWRDGDDGTLWAARVWSVGDATHTVDHALAMFTAPNQRFDGQRSSAAEIMARVNHQRLLQHRSCIEREIAFRNLARRVQIQVPMPTTPRAAVIAHGEFVRISAPVRIDLAGGWSDTPPICNDVGGSVVNAAVRLNGVQPISAVARLIEQHVVRVRSVDLNQSIEVRDSASLCAHRDPKDWAALPKAALVLAGLVPSDPTHDLARWLEALGGGIELTISSALPKGSGLGTSSILGAATLACLARIMGDAPSREHLILQCSALEQMMSTAGGWQDQAGGITSGAKLLTTLPGAMQQPLETPLSIPSDFWRERVLLYSTGLQRLARDILQNVVWRWLRGESEVRTIVQRLREGAHRMHDDLRAGDMDRFARGVLEYWELKKAIDPGATTPMIEAIIERVRPHLSAWELPGAGGGGFLFMIARDPPAAHRVREILNSLQPNGARGFFDVEIDAAGLTDMDPRP